MYPPLFPSKPLNFIPTAKRVKQCAEGSVSDPNRYGVRLRWPSESGYVFGILIQIQVVKIQFRKKNFPKINFTLQRALVN